MHNQERKKTGTQGQNGYMRHRGETNVHTPSTYESDQRSRMCLEAVWFAAVSDSEPDITMTLI